MAAPSPAPSEAEDADETVKGGGGGGVYRLPPPRFLIVVAADIYFGGIEKQQIEQLLSILPRLCLHQERNRGEILLLLLLLLLYYCHYDDYL